MHQLAWVRLMVARHPWVYWLVVALVAGGVGLGVAHAFADVEAAQRSWGEHRSVWVTTADIEAGQPVAAHRRDVPRAVVPDGVIDTIPLGAVALHHLDVGEIIVAPDVVPGGSAALVPEGWVAFAVAATIEHFATGDRLSVYSGDQRVGAGLVVAVGESDLMVATPAESAPAMAAALLADAVTIGLTP